MPRTLLSLALLCSQALALAGPGFVLCQPRYGGVHVEWAGPHGCDCCQHDDGAMPAGDPQADRPCDCRHTPLANGLGQPCVPADRPAVDPLPVGIYDGWVTGFGPVADVSHPRRTHDPPPPHTFRSSHLGLLAGVVLRC